MVSSTTLIARYVEPQTTYTIPRHIQTIHDGAGRRREATAGLTAMAGRSSLVATW
jgi:hypothetical protein